MSRIIVRDLPEKLKEDELRKHFADVDKITECSLRFNDQGEFRRFAFIGFKTKEAGAKAVKQLNSSFVSTSRIKVELARDIKQNKPKQSNNNNNNNKKSQKQEKKLKTKYKNVDAPPKELILETGRLFLRNLPYDCETEEVENLFSQFGENSASLIRNPASGNSIGTCFVKFSVAEEAMKAYEALDGTDFQGRLLHIMPAHPEKEKPTAEGNKVWKKKKEDKTPKIMTWNTLFVNSNTVTDILCQRLKISKSDLILQAKKASVPARIALGEAQIVSEIKEFLLANGVALDSFGQGIGPRSKTVILVKQLHAFTTEESLQKIFGRYGTILRLVVPPCGVAALVEFATPEAAKLAFEKLYNQTVDHTMLLLEWASINVFSAPPSSKSDADDKEDSEDAENDESAKEAETSEKTTKAKKEDSKPDKEKKKSTTKSCKFILKNVDFRATTQDIKELFNAHEGLKSVRLPKKQAGSGPEKHRGFAFVEFMTPEQAEHAFSDLKMSCHLYKRRLNFEWTGAEENVEMQRKRTAEKYSGGEAKKLKKSDLLSELNA